MLATTSRTPRPGRHPALAAVIAGSLLLSTAATAAPEAAGWHAPDAAAKGSILSELAKLTAGDGAAFDSFGQAVAIDGDTIVVGAPGDDGERGAVYVFVQPPAGWASGTQIAKLSAEGGGGGDRFGQAVAIDGDTIVVGEPASGGAQGAVYVFVRPAGGWTDAFEDAELDPAIAAIGDRFGWSVAIAGDTIVAGSTDHGGSGAAYVFERPAGGWIDAFSDAKLTASDGGGNDDFGAAVAVFADTVAVAALNHDGSRGAVYVFERPGGGWGDATEDAKLTDSDGQPGDQLGWSLAMDGDLIAGGAAVDDVGAINAGSVLVFEKPLGGWADGTQVAKLTASDGGEGDRLGNSLAVSADTVAAGAPAADVATVFNQGAAYVFVQAPSGWTDATETVRVVASDGAPSDAFGYGIGLSAGTLAVGARSLGSPTNVGSAYVYGPGEGCSLPPSFDGLETVTNPTGAGCGDLRLDWQPGSSNCGGSLVYNVFRSTAADFVPGAENLLADCVDDTAFVDDTVPIGVTHYYSVGAEDGAGVGAGLCAGGPSDANQRRQLGVATDAIVDLFFDDLEDGTAGWVTGNFGDAGSWVLVDDDSSSPTHSWFAADGSFCHKWLRLAEPLVILGNPAHLEFYHRFDTELGYDGGVLEYSVDGASWHDILADSLISLKRELSPPIPPPDRPPIPPNPDRFLAGGYNSIVSSDHPDSEFANRPAWSGDSGSAFTPVRVDLSDFAGYSVNFRWRIRCDAALDVEGWHVDDVRISFGNDCAGVFADGFESGNNSLWSN